MAYTQRQYAESDAVKKFRENMEAHGPYNSEWKPQIDSVRDSILNRKDFNYDVNGDALYQQYKDRFVNLGQQAMMDTMGQAAKLTGGYGNSNAQIVGQQAYHGYLQGLTDKIPELAQLAYQRYAQQGQDLYQKYGLLNTQEQADYNRWLAERDFLANQYNTERGFDYGQHRDNIAEQQWRDQFEYGKTRDEIADQQWKDQFEYGKTRDEVNDQRWKDQFEYGKARDEIADQQWKAQFDEDLRRFNFANQLGEFAPVAVPGGGGYDAGSGGSRSPAKPSAGYADALYLVENAASKESQESVIQNAYDKGYITQSEAKTLANKVGKTQYTKK